MPVTVNPRMTTRRSKVTTMRETTSHAKRKAANMTKGEQVPMHPLTAHKATRKEKGTCQTRISTAMFI